MDPLSGLRASVVLEPAHTTIEQEVETAIAQSNEVAIRTLFKERQDIPSVTLWKICKNFPQAISEACYRYRDFASHCLSLITSSEMREAESSVVLLVSQGADSNETGTDGLSAFQRACQLGLVNVVSAMLEGASSASHASGASNGTLPSIALQPFLVGSNTVDRVGQLLSLRDEGGNTALHHAIIADRVEIVELLLKVQQSIDAGDVKGRTALHHAALLGRDMSIMRLLLAKRCKIDAQDLKGATPLMLAARKRRLAPVKVLLQDGANLFIRDKNGHFPLREIVQITDQEIIDLVITWRDLNGKTALDYAAAIGDLAITSRLITWGCDMNAATMDGVTPLMLAVCKGYFDVVEELVARGAAPNQKNRHGETALHCAAEKGNLAITSLLITRRCDMNAATLEGVTPLMLAVSKGYPDVVGELLARGAAPNQKNRHGETALHYAAETGNLAITSLLIMWGCDMNAETVDGETPLMREVQYQHRDAVKLLLEGGANPMIENLDGNSPLSAILRMDDQEIIDLVHNGLTRWCWDIMEKGVCPPLSVLMEDNPVTAQNTLHAVLCTRNQSGKTVYQQMLAHMMRLGAKSDNICDAVRSATNMMQRFSTDNTSPLEVAFLLGDSQITKAVLQQLTEEQRKQGAHVLLERYPAHASAIMNMLFEINPYHMRIGNVRAESVIPDVVFRDMRDLAKLLLSDRVVQVFHPVTVNGDEVDIQALHAMVMVFLTRVQEERPFTGTPQSESRALSEYYLQIKKALTHVIQYLENSSVDPWEVIGVCVELASIRNLCGGPYFQRSISLYRQYCVGIPATFENKIYLKLQEGRDQVVDVMLARESYITEEHNVHAHGYIKKQIGYDMQLSDAAVYESHNDIYEMEPFIDNFRRRKDKKEFLQERFLVYYTPSFIVDWIVAQLQPNTELVGDFVTWGSKQLKQEVTGSERKKLQENKKVISPLQEQLLKFLFSVNPPQNQIDALKIRIREIAGEDFEPSQFASPLEIIKSAQRGAVLEQLVDQKGSPRVFALAMMLHKLGVISFAS